MVLLTLCKVLSWLWFGTTIAKLVAANMVLSIDCRAWCGDVPIPYPFGIGNDCSMNKSFEVHCNDSFNPPKLYLSSIQMELTAISLRGYARINNTVISSNCSNKLASSVAGVDLSSSPFRFSEVYNRFTATGCDNYATFVTYGSAQNYGSTVGGCLSVCNGSIGTTSGCYGLTCTSGCYGLTCCQTTIPPSIVSFKAYMQQVLHTKDGSGCKTAFMVDQSWLDEIKEESEISADKLSKLSYVPTVLQWGKDQGQCEISKPSEAFCSGSGYCWNSVDDRHLCVCSNPERELLELSYSYITRDCPEGDTCFNPKIYSCRLLCIYNPGSGGENCTCPSGYYSYGDSCYSEDWSFNSSNKTKIIIIGCASGFGSLLLILGLWGLYKIIKRQKESRLKQKFFKQNGGLLFQQQLCSTENNIEQTKIFASKDLEKATENYHINRIIGQGGQGTVYKGMLTDGRIVAIKKSKLMDASKISEFVNEVVILSQINHRNIVQLLGCCLETEVPLLVYEFIPNGTLFHYLHDEIEEYLVTWEMRLQIATEVANALSYLHSAAAIPIYHRDIKSSNILLDEKYRAKVADFGISKVIAFDQTHITTRVQGTFGYLDPEYFQSSQFTDKSDVYSFGVVLAELLTGQKPISTGRSAEERSLSTYFLLAMEDNRLIDILDYRIAEEGGKEEIAAVAQLARVCLNLNGRKRPTMKMVAVELETIRAKKGTHSVVHQDHKQVDCTTDVDFMGPWNVASSSTISSFNVTSPLLTSTF